MRSLLAAAFLLTSLPALAFDGIYDVRGGNPDRNGFYIGTAVIAKVGEIYRIAWTVAGKQIQGFGIADGDTLAVSVPAAGQVVLYRKDKDGRLLGRWAVLDQSVVSPEVLTPRKPGTPQTAPKPNVAPAPGVKPGKPEKAT
jgi:hypothetical protein